MIVDGVIQISILVTGKLSTLADLISELGGSIKQRDDGTWVLHTTIEHVYRG